MTFMLSPVSLAGKSLMESHSSCVVFLLPQSRARPRLSYTCSVLGSHTRDGSAQTREVKTATRPFRSHRQNSLEGPHESVLLYYRLSDLCFQESLGSGSIFCYKSKEWKQVLSTAYGEAVCGPTFVFFHRPHRAAVRIYAVT